jgi:coenzyme Q-binding protein COQ10
MPSYSDKKTLPFSAEQMFDLVLDVEKYPEFLPWVSGARILERKDDKNYFIAELTVKFKGFTGSYVSRVSYAQPDMSKEDTEWAVYVDLEKGPFKHLENRWIFHPLEKNECKIEFFLSFAFKSMLMDKMMGAVFTKATHKMISAFEGRARDLFSRA